MALLLPAMFVLLLATFVLPILLGTVVAAALDLVFMVMLPILLGTVVAAALDLLSPAGSR